MRPVITARLWLGAVACTMLALGGSLAVALPASAVTSEQSPADQIVVVTVNAHQRDLDSARLSELAKGLADRAGASPTGAVYTPDVIMVQEITESILIRLRDELNSLLPGARYAVVGLSTATSTGNVKVKMLMNSNAMTYTGRTTWTDVCDAGRIYQLVTVRENASGKEVAVAGVHFAPQDNAAGTDLCRQNNTVELRGRLAPYDDRGSVVGDFNRRAMITNYECDPEELSAPLEWYSTMTASQNGHVYRDAVRDYRRSQNLSMKEQWTFEKDTADLICDGTSGLRRMRMDYVFASDVLTPLEASADSPGWAGPTPGTVGCTPTPACKYSDHRFVWARLGLPPTPAPPIDSPPAAPAALTLGNAVAGRLDLDWADNTETDLAGYRVERSTDSGNSWVTVAPSVTSSAYADSAVYVGTTYSYRVFAVDNGGLVSGPSSVVTGTPRSTIHLGDLSGTRAATKTGWTATATVTVHDPTHSATAGAQVAYTWSAGKVLTGSCTTDTTGTCKATSGSLGKPSSVTFSVTGMTSATAMYDAALNDKGTTLLVTK